jgi:hypothetical protein
MSTNYLRQLSVVVAQANGQGLEFADFRCVFRVRRGDYQTPNSCDLRIYNLATATRNLISGQEFTQISVSAGYPGNFGLIFRGNIKQFRKGRVDAKDDYVDITAADSDEAYNFAPIFHSAPAGTKPGGIANALLLAFQGHGLTQAISAGSQAITAGFQPTFSQNGCVRGRVLYGMARDESRDFAWSQNCKWSLQDGELTFIPFTSYIAGQIQVISPSTGLLGVPEQTQQGINIRVQLNPNMKIGQTVSLQNTAINQLRFGLDSASLGSNTFLNQQVLNTANPSGLYYVMVANHVGDSRGNDWYTDMTCLAVDATIPSADAANALTTLSDDAIKRYN